MVSTQTLTYLVRWMYQLELGQERCKCKTIPESSPQPGDLDFVMLCLLFIMLRID